MKFAIVAAAVFAASGALAGEVDFSAHITDLDGKDIPSSAAKDARPVLLSDVAGLALLNEMPPANPRDPAQAQNPTEKLSRFNLAVKIHGAAKVDLTAEEITLLKTAISQVYPPLIVGRAVQMLDPPAASNK